MRRLFRRLAIGFGVIAVVVAVAVGMVFYLTGGVVAAADSFFTVLAHDGADRAYQDTAEAFRTATPKDAFERFANQLGLSKYQSSSWTERSFSGSTGQVAGTLTLAGGGTVPIRVQLVKEAGTWRVYHLTTDPAPGISGPTQTAAFPDAPARVTLVRGTLSLLRDAVRRDDFTDLRDAGATAFRQQFTPADLSRAFHGFVERRIDLADDGRPENLVVNEPDRAGNGAMILRGQLTTPRGHISTGSITCPRTALGGRSTST